MLAKRSCSMMIFLAFLVSLTCLEAGPKPVLDEGAKVFIAAMPDGFDTYLKAAIEKKKVPLTVVGSKEEADYEITGASETQKAGKAKKILRLNWHSAEQASISVTNLKTGEIVFAYSVNKESSAHGKQSTAEACAKNLKKAVRKSK